MLDGYGDSFAKPNAGDAAMFQANGYTVSKGRSTVTALRALAGKDVGVLFLSGHGGGTNILPVLTTDSTGYGIWTATIYDSSKAAWANFSADIADHSLTFMVAPDNYERDKSGKVMRDKNGDTLVLQTWHYAILPYFLIKYKPQFAQDSLVMLNACSGATAAASAIQSAFFSANASMVAGWTDTELVATGYKSASYLFDRMLGANTIPPSVAPGNPPRRAFSFTESKTASDLTQLTNYTWSETFPTSVAGVAFVKNYHPILQPGFVKGTTATTDQFTILKPAIVSDTVQTGVNGANPKLVLTGYFGTPGGKNSTLMVGNATPTVLTSDNYSLTAPISATNSGPVTVMVNRSDGATLTSNTRNLSAWTGKFIITTNDYGQTDGFTSTVCTINANFRVDIQSGYIKPDDATPTVRQPVTQFGHAIYPIGESAADTCSVTGDGTSHYITKDPSTGQVIYSQTDVLSGSLTATTSPSGGQGFFGATLSLPPDPTQPAYFQLLIDTQPGLSLDQTIFDPSGSDSGNTTLHPNGSFTSEIFVTNSGDQWVPIKIDKSYNIAGPLNPPLIVGSTSPGNAQIMMTFPSMSCTSPPVGNTAR
jgi:hypothetical protein